MSKAFNHVSWLYICLLLGFKLDFINRIMCCITSAYFAILINGFASPFFKVEHWLRQGCPLSPLLFPLEVEGLSRALEETRSRHGLMGLRVASTLRITHLLFVDDILIFSDDSRSDAHLIKEALVLFEAATVMEIVNRKSTITPIRHTIGELKLYLHFFSFNLATLVNGFKYLGFLLKPNAYTSEAWKWLT